MITLKRYAVLCRLPIAAFAAYSAGIGHLLAPDPSPAKAIGAGLAVFILAAGASALNQYQERRTDAMMERTRRRPLPANLITPARAIFFSLMLISAGLGLLLVTSGTLEVMLGILALTWYNGVYTGLKRLTAFAAVPGSVVGMIPPAIGWSSAGAAPADPRLFAVCFLFFIWQVPHFWLQVLHHGEEYHQAHLPSLTDVLSTLQIARVSFVWICAAAASGLLLPLYGAVTSPFLYFLLIPGSVWLVVKSFKLMSVQKTPALAHSAFKSVNAYLVFVLSVLACEKVYGML